MGPGGKPIFFKSRPLRAKKRVRCNFNTQLCFGNVFKDTQSLKTITVNASEIGCFLFYSGKWLLNTPVSMVLNELSDPTPIEGEIRWGIPWGDNMVVPGIGIRFSQINDSQMDEINEISKKSRPATVAE